MNRVKAEKLITTRGLPKTGQTVENASGDDGTYEAGWWAGQKVSDNKTRFVSKTIDGDDIVIDKATGLIWPADGIQLGCNDAEVLNWSLSITYAESLSFAGFDDWRLPNIFELSSIINYAIYAMAMYTTFFSNFGIIDYWSSTTSPETISIRYCVNFEEGVQKLVNRASDRYLCCVRGGLV